MHFDRLAPLNTTRSIVALLLAAASLALPEMAPASTGGRAEPTIPRGVPLASWQDNGHGGSYLLELAQGRPLAPGARAVGVVLSDSDCAPDAQGLNHCRNVIELADGSRIVVTNTHVMARNRCLANGDRLALRAVNASWMMGDLGGR